LFQLYGEIDPHGPVLPPHAALTRSGSMSYDAQSQRVGSSRTRTRLPPLTGDEKTQMPTSPPSAPPRLPPRPAVDRTSSADTASPMSATTTHGTQLPIRDSGIDPALGLSTNPDHSSHAEVPVTSGEAGALAPVITVHEDIGQEHSAAEVSPRSDLDDADAFASKDKLHGQ
jgi:hypothetical protein